MLEYKYFCVSLSVSLCVKFSGAVFFVVPKPSVSTLGPCTNNRASASCHSHFLKAQLQAAVRVVNPPHL